MNKCHILKGLWNYKMPTWDKQPPYFCTDGIIRLERGTLTKKGIPSLKQGQKEASPLIIKREAESFIYFCEGMRGILGKDLYIIGPKHGNFSMFLFLIVASFLFLQNG